MEFLNFTKDNKLGITEIDKQHKNIYATVNHLYEIQNGDKPEIIDTFNSLLSQLKDHFVTEEQFMKDHKVIQFISHKLEHDRALEKYSNYFKNYKSSKKEFDPEILSSLKNWLLNHHEKKDIKLKDIVQN